MTKVQRYKVGYYTDEWGMSSNTPCLIPDDSGYAVKFEDYCKLETELAALKAENEALRKDAERYQWLKSQEPSKHDGYAIGYFDTCGVDAWRMTTKDLDQAIDAAMSQGEQG